MFKVGDYVIPKDSKTIKVINEIEEIENQFIIYMTDNSSYHISQLLTLNVFLQRDPSLHRKSKYKPVVPLYERYRTLMAIRYIDEVYVYQTEEELYDLMTFFKPDIRILGEDYIGKSFTGDDLPPKVIYTSRSHGWSTTRMKDMIAMQTIKQNPEVIEDSNYFERKLGMDD